MFALNRQLNERLRIDFNSIDKRNYNNGSRIKRR